VDSKAVEFIHQSSYVFADNDPVGKLDVNGEEPNDGKKAKPSVAAIKTENPVFIKKEMQLPKDNIPTVVISNLPLEKERMKAISNSNYYEQKAKEKSTTISVEIRKPDQITAHNKKVKNEIFIAENKARMQAANPLAYAVASDQVVSVAIGIVFPVVGALQSGTMFLEGYSEGSKIKMGFGMAGVAASGLAASKLSLTGSLYN